MRGQASPGCGSAEWHRPSREARRTLTVGDDLVVTGIGVGIRRRALSAVQRAGIGHRLVRRTLLTATLLPCRVAFVRSYRQQRIDAGDSARAADALRLCDLRRSRCYGRAPNAKASPLPFIVHKPEVQRDDTSA
jgi:hypothetical protein